jgi:hypothetical protein
MNRWSRSAAHTLVVGIFYCSAVQATPQWWENGDFKRPQPQHGSFVVMDSGQRFGGWRVVGDPGNVAWVSGAYRHNGFSFFAPVTQQQTSVSWVNLAGPSQSATGIAHFPVATTVGQTYTLTFYVGNIYDTVGLYGTSSTLAVYENDTLLGTATNSDGAGTTVENWKQFSMSFVADAPYTTIAFINMDRPGDQNCGLGDTLLAPAKTPIHAKGRK